MFLSLIGLRDPQLYSDSEKLSFTISEKSFLKSFQKTIFIVYFYRFLLEPRELNYMSRDFAKMTAQISAKLWTEKTEPYLLLNRRIGNTYTASLYLQLITFFHW